MRILTIGFTKKTARRFFGLLRESGARRVVDVRISNGSQLAGLAKKDDLAWFLGELCGIDYVHLPELAPTKELLRAWRTGGVAWADCEARFLDPMREREIERTVPPDLLDDGRLLCSEDKPRHCRRRPAGEYLDARWGGVEIAHLGEAAPASRAGRRGP